MAINVNGRCGLRMERNAELESRKTTTAGIDSTKVNHHHGIQEVHCAGLPDDVRHCSLLLLGL
jgi:hypothetical protein